MIRKFCNAVALLLATAFASSTDAAVIDVSPGQSVAAAMRRAQTYRGWGLDGDGRGDVLYEANDIVDRLTWQYPMAKLLLTSPSMQALRFAARQFPVLRAPSVVEQHPRMKPWNPNWSKWNATTPD